MERQKKDLEDERRTHLGKVVLPVWVFGGLGAMFAIGMALLLAGLFLPSEITGPFGTMLSVVGAGGAISVAVAKLLIERHHEKQLVRCQKQAEMLAQQIEQAHAEREELDKVLPSGGGPLTARLQAAEKTLATLEDLVPLETERHALTQEQEAAAATIAQAELDRKAATAQWRRALAAAGLPTNLRPRDLRRMAKGAAQAAELAKKLAPREQERHERRRALEDFSDRVRAVFAQAGVTPTGTRLVEQLRQLRQLVSEQQSLADQRHALRSRAMRLRRRGRKYAGRLARLATTRFRLLRASGAADEATLEALVARGREASTLQQRYTLLCTQITAALGSRYAESALAELIASQDKARIEAQWESGAARLQQLEGELRQRHQRLGQLQERLNLMTQDRTPAEKQLQLGEVEARLAAAIERWQVLAVTHRLLDTIREIYQRHRQPQALRDASGYLARLTAGRYPRVWTPLDQHRLLVDDAEGNSLPVEVLSRGTREQLFLALRLAIVAQFAARGVNLPLVLDDILVNFDGTRGRAAAQVLRDFAAEGHQMLVFTCHDHIQKLFRSLRVPVRRLPEHLDASLKVLGREGVTSVIEPQEMPEPVPVAPQVMEPVALEPPPAPSLPAPEPVATYAVEAVEVVAAPAAEIPMVVESTPLPVAPPVKAMAPAPVAKPAAARSAPATVREVTYRRIRSTDDFEEFAGEFGEEQILVDAVSRRAARLPQEIAVPGEAVNEPLGQLPVDIGAWETATVEPAAAPAVRRERRGRRAPSEAASRSIESAADNDEETEAAA